MEVLIPSPGPSPLAPSWKTEVQGSTCLDARHGMLELRLDCSRFGPTGLGRRRQAP